MNLRPMKPAESRIAAIGLLVLVVLLAYFVLLHWWFVAPLRDIDSQMDDLRDTQSRYAAAIAQKPQLQKRLSELGRDSADSSTFLSETDPNAAAASLMQRVVDDAAAHAQEGSCEVSQKMPVANPAVTPGDPYKKVVVSISLHCDMQPLIGLLYTLEKGKPYLFVQDFSVYRNPLVAAQKSGAAPLEVQFTLGGYVHAPAGTGSSADDNRASSGGDQL
ncbi:type II secretion system protein GspM [Dyella psychrodurans]|uniref:General secretion pathway protein GspM n=1 Tax=Dyella psychrodurans TaxID=1927960 RepID=A0A370X4P2_9GAMM|nr:type II secretion system protein GspM [Dyella psychrodurans]RDS83211.1 general secretion pathway protein GspM [Dyella psychrodurans]